MGGIFGGGAGGGTPSKPTPEKKPPPKSAEQLADEAKGRLAMGGKFVGSGRTRKFVPWGHSLLTGGKGDGPSAGQGVGSVGSAGVGEGGIGGGPAGQGYA